MNWAFDLNNFLNGYLISKQFICASQTIYTKSLVKNQLKTKENISYISLFWINKYTKYIYLKLFRLFSYNSINSIDIISME